jgi:hypothetical protein
VAFFAVTVAFAVAMDNKDDDFGALQAESAAAAAAAAEAEASAIAAENALRNNAARSSIVKSQIAHSMKFSTVSSPPAAAPKAQAAPAPAPSSSSPPLAKGLVAAAGSDNGVTKPWEFFATSYTVTMSWISFSIILIISCFLGGVGGWCTRKACGERKSREFTVDTSAHNLY